MTQSTTAHLEEHYADLKEKKFFPGLIKYMASGELFFHLFTLLLHANYVLLLGLYDSLDTGTR